MLSYTQNLLDNEECCLLHDAHGSNYLVFDHKQYSKFTLDVISEEECLASFRFRKREIPNLAHTR